MLYLGLYLVKEEREHNSNWEIYYKIIILALKAFLSKNQLSQSFLEKKCAIKTCEYVCDIQKQIISVGLLDVKFYKNSLSKGV